MKRWSLRLLIASIVISGLFGVWALLSGELGELQARVLWTSLCVTGATLFISACALAWDRHTRDIAPPLGILASVIGYGMLALAAWVDIGSERYFQIALSAVLAGLSLAHISLLSLARLALRYRFVTGLAMLVSMSLAGLLIALLFWHYPPDWVGRAFGALVIAAITTTTLVAVLHRMNRDFP